MSKHPAKATTTEDRYIGERIREARIALGMTQKDLGGLLGVSYQQVQKYEDGANRINGARITKLMSALNRPFNYFYPGATDIRATTGFSAMLASKAVQELLTNYSRCSPAWRNATSYIAAQGAKDD